MKELGLKEEAKSIFIESVSKYPWNWSAWYELTSLSSESDIEHSLEKIDHWMKNFFIANLALEMQYNDESITCYEQLFQIFSESSYIRSQIAIANYNKRGCFFFNQKKNLENEI